MANLIIAEQSASKQNPYVPYNRSLVCERGINDFPAPTRGMKSYEVWRNMLKRCYSKDRSIKDRTYEDCTVSAEWHYFSNFERWYSANYVEGCRLDKDLLVQGNKVYAADFCVLVSLELNGLLGDCARARGILPLGVSASGTKFKARVHRDGCSVYLGLFSTPQLAHKAWQEEKAYAIYDFITDDLRVRTALDRRIKQLRDDIANNRITTKL